MRDRNKERERVDILEEAHILSIHDIVPYLRESQG